MADHQKFIKWVQSNSISCYVFYETKGRHKEKPILIFFVWPIVTLQLPVWMLTKTFKSQYLGFYSSDLKAEDSVRNISPKRIHGEKPIFIFWVFHLQKSLWIFNFPLGYFLALDPGEIFESWVFSFSPKSFMFSRISIEVTFWFINLEKPTPFLGYPSWAQVENISKAWRRIGFWKNSKCWIHT